MKKNNIDYLFILINAVLRNEQPPELPKGGDFYEIFKLADFHSVSNLVYYGIEKLDKKPDSVLIEKWSRIRDLEIMRDITQCAELEHITTKFTEANIRFITLKGTILKALYPQSDFRSMADIDLLIDEKNLEKAGEILISIGYETKLIRHTNHDVYYKKPVMNIELHHKLFNSTRENFAEIFENIWGKTINVTGTRYQLEPNYCFAYIIAHAMGHYKWGGTGIRSFMDFYIYRIKASDKLNMDVIQNLFSNSEERELFNDFISLSDIWFANAPNSNKYHKMTNYILKSGTYGTFENQVKMGMEGKNKIIYLFEKFFPSLDYMRDQFPILKRFPVFLPLFWFIRMIRGATINRKQNIAKYKAFRNK